jgi:HAD superfamily hydrolase (TIGR01509 family)
MDGLMFNTEDLYDKVGAMLLKPRGHQYTQELKLKMMGLPGAQAFEVMRQELGIDDSNETLQRDAEAIFKDLLPAEIAIMPGLEQLLALLERLKIPKGICTSSHRRFAQRALGFFDLEPRFSFILTADDVENGKPHPEVYLQAARNFGIEPSSMLVLEDSLTGSRAGVASGAYTVAVPTSHSRGQDYSHVAYVANALNDSFILNLFKSS